MEIRTDASIITEIMINRIEKLLIKTDIFSTLFLVLSINIC